MEVSSGLWDLQPAHLSDARLEMLPWGHRAEWAAAPPLRTRTGRNGVRLCHLCAAPYDTMACGPQCPRYYQMSRRNVTWVGGFWAPVAMARSWAAADQRAWAAANRRDPVEPEPPPPRAAQGAALDPRLLFKPPPTSAMMADYAARQAAAGPTTGRGPGGFVRKSPPPRPPPTSAQCDSRPLGPAGGYKAPPLLYGDSRPVVGRKAPPVLPSVPRPKPWTTFPSEPHGGAPPGAAASSMARALLDRSRSPSASSMGVFEVVPSSDSGSEIPTHVARQVDDEADIEEQRSEAREATDKQSGE